MLVNDKLSIHPVDIYRLVKSQATQTLSLNGTTKSVDRAVLRFQVSGRVLSKNVRIGDKVVAGQELISLYNPEIKPLVQRALSSLAQAKTQLSQAKKDYIRLNELYNEEAITRNEWEQAKTKLDNAQSIVDGAKVETQRAERLAKELIVAAPFDGVITQVNTDKGDSVQIGREALHISNPNKIELELPVSALVASKLVKGQAVEVMSVFSASKTVIQGVIQDISKFRERGALPQIVVSLPISEIGPGEAVSVELQIPIQTGLNVPIKAVIMTGEDSSAVYVLNDQTSTVKLVPIRPIRIDSFSVLVEGPLTLGDQIIVAGVTQLYDGAKVKVRSKNNNLNKSSEVQ